MITGIVIPHETNMAIQKVEFENLADYQTAVGGYIETINVDEHPLLIIANEEGKFRRLPVNRRATYLWWLLNPRELDGDALVGDVLILGPIERGEITDAPDKIVTLLLESELFQVQVCMSKELDAWVSIGPPVDEFFEAALRALKLVQAWTTPGDVKVIAVE